jgi:uncharacterized membrane protein YGL010W
MKSLVDRLASYAEYHRDKRNIATHFVGIPMILVGNGRRSRGSGHRPINAAVGATGLAARYYRALDPTYGAAMAAVLGATCGIGTAIASLPLPLWAGATTGLLVGGWALQLVGHYFEGRKPAFLDDIKSLLDGPLFLVAEVAFSLGLSSEMRQSSAGQPDAGAIAATEAATAVAS